jgi:hypothetical protein
MTKATFKSPEQLQAEEERDRKKRMYNIGPAQQDQAMRQQMFLDQPQANRSIADRIKNMSPEELKNMQNQWAVRKDQVRLEGGPAKRPEVQYIKSGQIKDPVTRQNRFPTPEERKAQKEENAQIQQPKNTPPQLPPLMGPQQQFNAMQQQMYQTQPQPAQQQPQPEQPQPTQQQNQLQEQQPKQIEQIAPVKKTFIKRKNTEM